MKVSTNSIAKRKLLKSYGLKGYGCYYYLCEALADNGGKLTENDLKDVAFLLGESEEYIATIVYDLGLFQRDEWGNVIDPEIKAETDRKADRSEKARQSAMARWENAKAKAEKPKRTRKPKEVKPEPEPQAVQAVEVIPEETKSDVVAVEGDGVLPIVAEVAEVAPTEEEERFANFREWLANNAPYLSNERNIKQLTLSEFSTLRAKYGGQELAKTILDLENRKDLRKKYVSLYRTLNNWCKNGTNKQSIRQSRADDAQDAQRAYYNRLASVE